MNSVPAPPVGQLPSEEDFGQPNWSGLLVTRDYVGPNYLSPGALSATIPYTHPPFSRPDPSNSSSDDEQLTHV